MPLLHFVPVKRKHSHREPLTLERLLQARAAIAYAITLDGAVYAPVFERLEREIAILLAADDVMARARRCLEELSRRCNCRILRRRLERDRLQIFQLQTEAVTIAILWLVGAMAHHLVDQLLRRLHCFEPILKAVPE